MRKTLSLTLFLASVVALIMILSSFFPKYRAVIIFLAVFLLGDRVLWFFIRDWISGHSPVIKFSLTILYWLPALTLFTLVIIGFIVPFIYWDVTVKAILLSLLMMTIVAKVIPLLVSLLSWLTGQFVRIVFNAGTKWIKWVNVAAVIMGALLWLLLGLGMITWVYDFKVMTLDISSSKIPSSFDNLRIVQFSDVHLGNWTCDKKLLEAVHDINDLKPDLIVFTGDMFTYSTAEGRGFTSYFKQLHARYGIFAIMGNHDYGDYVKWKDKTAKQQNLEDLKAFYSGMGWSLLLNQSVVIRSGADSFNIVGVENWGAARRFQRYGDILKAEKGINKSCFNILLSHDPSYWDSIVCKLHPEIDLTLSGHTHGGQFGIETSSFRWSILSWSNPLWGGYYVKNKAGFNSALYVNRGLGTIGYAGRVGIRPEITLIRLHHSK